MSQNLERIVVRAKLSMTGSLRASARGLEIVDRARKKKGWTKTVSVAWWQAALTSQATLRRFWRQLPIQQETFIKICEAVGISNWEQIADGSAVEEPQGRNLTIVDRLQAPDVSSFYGRKAELASLEQWIVGDRCHVVAILGMAGIGKTHLAVMLADNIQHGFNYLIWRSLSCAPPITDMLAQLLRCLSPHMELDLPEDVNYKISQLIDALRQHRCLLILDGFETILRSGGLAGQYCQGYEGYGELIRRVGQERHQSCLVLTSRESPKEIGFLEAQNLPVRLLSLTGLQEAEAQDIFREKGLSDQDKWGKLIQIYRTNPLVLQLIAAAVKESFQGRVGEFLKQNTIYLGYISDILSQQFERLSELEKEIMRQIAINGQPVSRDKLRDDLGTQISASKLIDAIESLNRRSLIEQIAEEKEIIFTLQPVVMKYVANQIKTRNG